MEIPGYRIEQELGQGGMATVYLAVQVSLEREVALKVMTPALAADASFRQRFLKEGKIIARLRHPHVVTIYDIGAADSHYYMAMEYLGIGLKEAIAEGVPPAQAVTVLRQMADALRYAHAQGFVHRDIKPANILFRTDDTAVLTDFGIAKAVSGHTELTAAGWTVGTPQYMSPEQAAGKPVTARSDLYSLGIVFFEMLTGRKPYEGSDSFATAMMHRQEPLPTLPAELERFQPLLDGLLAKEPEARFADAGALLVAPDALPHSTAEFPTTVWAGGLTRLQPTDSLREGSGGSSERAQRIKQHRLWGAGVAVILAGLVSLGGYYLSIHQEGLEENSQENPSTLTLDEQAKVKRLLEAAKAHMAVQRLTQPPGSNAYEAYQRVLELDPGNEIARQGLKRIEQYQTQQSQEANKR